MITGYNKDSDLSKHIIESGKQILELKENIKAWNKKKFMIKWTQQICFLKRGCFMKRRFIIRKILSIVFSIFYIVPNVYAKNPKMKEKIRNELVFLGVLRPDLTEIANAILIKNAMDPISEDEKKNLNLLFDAIIANISEMLSGPNKNKAFFKIDLYSSAMMHFDGLSKNLIMKDHSNSQEYLDYILLGAILGENISLAHALILQGANPNTAVISREIIINHLPDDLFKLMKIHSKTADFVGGFAESMVTSDWCKRYPLHSAAYSNNLDLIPWLISEGFSINTKDSKGSAPIHFAVLNRNFEMVKLLLGFGANVNVDSDCMRTPLFMAFMFRRVDIMNILIAKGADVNEKYFMGETLLYYAVCRNDIEVIKFLIDCGIKVNVKDEKGRSPLYLATDPAVIALLKEKI